MTFGPIAGKTIETGENVGNWMMEGRQNDVFCSLQKKSNLYAFVWIALCALY